jgi:L-rhamnose isomerase
MDEDIKSMCLELARLAMEIEDIYVSLTDYNVNVHHYKFGEEDSRYFKSVSFKYDKNVAESIKEALEYVKSLGGNNNEI